MDEQRQSRYGPTRKQLVWVGVIVSLALLIIVISGYLFGWKWTGLPKRTLWDWLQLPIIPAVLAGGGLWFNKQQRTQELQTADKRAQDDALQAYLDHMSDMLTPKKDQPSLADERPPKSLRSVARARTITVLARLDESLKEWSTERVRNLISVLLVSGFLSTTILVIVLMALNKAPENLLQTAASLYSGVTGAVLGYYFGKGQS